MYANRLIYVVVCKVVDAFGPEIVGVGAHPLLIAVDDESDAAIGVFGSEQLHEASFIKTTDGGVSDVVYNYLNECGVADFLRATSKDVSVGFLKELISAALDKDGSDFEVENDIPLTILSGTELQNEAMLSDLIGLHGVWIVSKDDLDVQIDVDPRLLCIDGDSFEDVGAVVGEILLGKGDQTTALLHT